MSAERNPQIDPVAHDVVRIVYTDDQGGQAARIYLVLSVFLGMVVTVVVEEHSLNTYIKTVPLDAWRKMLEPGPATRDIF